MPLAIGWVMGRSMYSRCIFVSSVRHYTRALATPRFWFESFQNWQSEFLAIGAMILLSIYLRQRSSSQLKPVER